MRIGKLETLLLRILIVAIAIACSKKGGDQDTIAKHFGDRGEVSLQFPMSEKESHTLYMFSFRPPLVFYNFKSHRSVLKLMFENNFTFPIEAALYLFKPDESERAIAEWMNSQWSDVMAMNSAEPQSVHSIPADSCLIISQLALERVKDVRGEFAPHEVEFRINSQQVKGKFKLETFQDQADHNVRCVNEVRQSSGIRHQNRKRSIACRFGFSHATHEATSRTTSSCAPIQTNTRPGESLWTFNYKHDRWAPPFLNFRCTA
ncbi:MAG: hypothetical protein RIR26_1232 [Pseudomonadota bacterium]|jgi:hypothetical protein